MTKPAPLGRGRQRHRLALGVCLGLLACAGDPPLGDCMDCAPPEISGLLVSEPLPAPAGAGAGRVAWVALEPGSAPDGFTAEVHTSSGGAVRRPVINGGFDPAPLAAREGDTVLVTVTDHTGRLLVTRQAEVRGKKPPVIVRTEPPPRKRDVPLNASMLVVFSEPLDPGTVTDQTVRLFKGAIPLTGQVRLSPDGLSAIFQPVGSLQPNTAYTFDITAGVRGLDGEPLATPQQVVFSTGDQSSGFLRVITSTTGLSLDPDGYRVIVDADTSGAPVVRAPDTLMLAIREGAHTIAFMTSAPNCAVLNPTWSGTVQSAQTTTIRALVDCALGPRTGLYVELVTTGADLPEDFVLTLCSPTSCSGWRWGGVVLANSTEPIEMPVGTYSFDLTRVPINCSGRTSGAVAVVDGQMTTLRLELVCSAGANLRVTAMTSGTGAPDTYLVRVAGQNYLTLPASGSLTLSLAPGSQTVSLDVPFNCALVGSNQATVDLTSGTTTDVTFVVNCQTPGLVIVSAPTEGWDRDDDYVVTLDGHWRGPVSAGSTTPLTVAAGTYLVGLEDIAPNCTLFGPNPVPVSVGWGETKYIDFPVACVHSP